MSDYKIPDEEEMAELELLIVKSLKSFSHLEYRIFYEEHIHDIWHQLDGVITSLREATEKAEKLMKELGYEHD